MREKIKTIGRVRTAYRNVFDRSPALLAPKRFTEKLQWRKLFDNDPRYTIFSDKLAVRGYIEQHVGPDYLMPLIWSGEPDAIPFASLDYPCVLKSTHASGHVIFLPQYDDRRRDEILATARSWMSINHGVTADEPGYRNVPPRVMVERLVTNDKGEAPYERRLFVFDGRVAFVNTVFPEDGRIRNGAFHKRDWKLLDWYFSRKVEREFLRPERLDDMIVIAEKLGRDLDHVRVDFFDCGSRIPVGEMTLYSWSGFAKFNSDEADFALGAPWRIRRPAWRALTATILDR